jgi:glucosamine 6-phosphate synthetase-like amidotransferase/phosphosugar isomerase protein
VTPLLENILHQPAALGSVARYQHSEGREALERAAALLKGSERVIVSGMGPSFYASCGFAYALNSSGLCAQSIEASELLYFLDSQVGEETALCPLSCFCFEEHVRRILFSKTSLRAGSYGHLV